jgi:aspartyl-tRNA(Asn)/glutamyl-tRNA(Gln) amidotransferase subunit A
MSLPDLHSAALEIRRGQSTAALQMQRSLHIAEAVACSSVFRSLNAQALRQAQATSKELPLAGLAVSVKDLFDVAGEVSASGSTVMANNPAAVQDCPAVARLKAAGGVLLGRTHQVEFAFSGVGVNPHFGTPVNPAALAVDSTPRVPGGSSSGAAVSVATGAAFVGLGSDTGGSIRIPAALCGLVGFKPTARTVPLAGAVPLSHSLDSVGALTRSVRDASLVHGILSGSAVPPATKSLKDLRLALPQTLMLDALEPQVARSVERSLSKLSAAGVKIEPIAFAEIAEIAGFQSKSGFAAPELLAWLTQGSQPLQSNPAQSIWPHRKADMDPRVAQRVALAEKASAADYVRLQLARAAWIERVAPMLEGFDGLLSPTVPIVAPSIASVAPGEAQDAEFFRVNALLLRNTSVVNFLDGCGISLPNHEASELPTGLMLWHSALHDAQLLQTASLIESIL